jgi:hypothetical protein
VHQDQIVLLTLQQELVLLGIKGRKLDMVRQLKLPSKIEGPINDLAWSDQGPMAITKSHIIMWAQDWQPQVISQNHESCHFSAPLAAGLFLINQTNEGSRIERMDVGKPSLVSAVEHQQARLSAYDGERQLAIITSTHRLQIWDIFTSEFSSGLELDSDLVSSPFRLEWLPIRNAQPLLMVASNEAADIYIQQRKDYFVDTDKWQLLTSIKRQDFDFTTALWLVDQSIVTIQENQISLHPASLEFLQASRRPTDPLPAYHPQFLEQCLLSDKLVLVNEVVEHLDRKMGLVDDVELRQQLEGISSAKLYVSEASNVDSTHPQSLLIKLDADHALPLSPLEVSHLKVVLQTLIEVADQRRSLDANGMRFLIAMRGFFIHHALQHSSDVPQSAHGPRLRYRDMIWAFFSESQELLLQDCHRACSEKVTWPEARSLGVFLWLTSHEALVRLFFLLGLP